MSTTSPQNYTTSPTNNNPSPLSESGGMIRANRSNPPSKKGNDFEPNLISSQTSPGLSYSYGPNLRVIGDSSNAVLSKYVTRLQKDLNQSSRVQEQYRRKLEERTKEVQQARKEATCYRWLYARRCEQLESLGFEVDGEEGEQMYSSALRLGDSGTESGSGSGRGEGEESEEMETDGEEGVDHLVGVGSGDERVPIKKSSIITPTKKDINKPIGKDPSPKDETPKDQEPPNNQNPPKDQEPAPRRSKRNPKGPKTPVNQTKGNETKVTKRKPKYAARGKNAKSGKGAQTFRATRRVIRRVVLPPKEGIILKDS